MIHYFSQFTDRIIGLEHTNYRILAEPDCSFKKKTVINAVCLYADVDKCCS